MIKTFRGLIVDGGQDTIVLHTNDGSTGYRIVKFQLMPLNFNVTDEYNVKVWKVSTTGSMTFDFNDNTLLAGGYFENSSASTDVPATGSIIFDNEVFNQDIYVTQNSQSGNACNYYLELEQIKLNENESTVATLKDIRNTK